MLRQECRDHTTARPAKAGQKDISQAATVGIRPAPKLFDRHLSGDDFALVRQWIVLNQAALIEFWEGRIDTAEVLARLVKVSTP